MNIFIGYWIMNFAITIFSVFIFGWDLEIKDKILIIVLFSIFIGLLEIGVFLMTGGN